MKRSSMIALSIAIGIFDTISIISLILILINNNRCSDHDTMIVEDDAHIKELHTESVVVQKNDNILYSLPNISGDPGNVMMLGPDNTTLRWAPLQNINDLQAEITTNTNHIPVIQQNMQNITAITDGSTVVSGHILTNLANTNDIGASNTIFKTLYVNKVTELSEPMNNTDAATKLYVDSLMNQVQTESDIQTANINKLQMNINNLRHLLVQQWQQVINPV